MYSTLFTTTFIFALAALRARAEFSVNTVSLTQCQPATLTWPNTNGPYDVIIVPSSQPCGDPLVDLGDLDSNKFDWAKVNISAGTQVMISVLDGQDQEGWSGIITVGSSDDKSCLSQDSSNPPTTTPNTPNATPLGAANAGKLGNGNGAPTFRLSGAAVAVTALGVLAALL